MHDQAEQISVHRLLPTICLHTLTPLPSPSTHLRIAIKVSIISYQNACTTTVLSSAIVVSSYFMVFKPSSVTLTQGHGTDGVTAGGGAMNT